MPDYGDIGGGYPPPYDTGPDLASLRFPWSDPPPDLGIVGPPPPVDASLAGNPYAPPPLEPDILPPPPPPATVAALPDITIRPEQPSDTPDALTGVAPRPGTPEAAQAAAFGDAERGITPEQHYQQTAQQYAGDPLAIPDDVERKRALDSLDPYQLAGVNARDKERRDAFIAERRKAYVDADTEAARQHMEDLKAANAATQAKMEATLADAQRLSDTKIDPSGGVTGVRRLAGIVASVIGGLVQSRTGAARNAGLDAYSEAINTGIEAQKVQIANKRGAIDMKRNVLAAEFARHGDMYQAEEAVRLASWRHVDDMLAFEQQNYDPRGRTALLITNQRHQIGAAMQQAQATAQQKFFDNHIKLQDAARQQQIANETTRHNRAGENVDYGKLASEAANRASAAADRAAARDARQADKEAERADKLSDREHKEVLERAIGGEVIPVKDEHGNAIGSKVGYITTAKGDIWKPNGTEAQISDLQKQHAAATSLVQTLDAIRRVGPEWLSDTHNTDKFQQLHQLMGDARLQAIAAKNLGVPTGHDIELAEAFLGTSDATRRKDSIAGLVQARDSIVRDHNATLRTHGLDKPWAPADTSTPPPVKSTGEDRAVKKVLGPAADAKPDLFTSSGDVVPADAIPRPGVVRDEIALRRYGAPFERLNRGLQKLVDAEVPTEIGRGQQRQQLDSWGAELRGADPALRKSALQHLTDVAGSESSKGAAEAATRKYAQSIIDSYVGSDIPMSPEQVR